MSNSKLVLIDGSSYLYRAYHALPKLSSSKGDPTGALLGVLNMINKLCREEPTEHIAVVFDAPGKTFRDSLFEEYKANRPPMPDDLRPQVEPLLAAVQAMGLPLLRVEGVEADDVIGTLCRRAVAQGMNVIVSTSDKDMAQLVDEHITLVNTMTGSVLDRDGVKRKFDVWPEQIIDWIALVGDASDNIPGVPKVGAKTAAKWLNEYGTIDGIIANADAIGGKVGESLRENLERLRLSRRLATIHSDVALPFRPEELERKPPDVESLKRLYAAFELKALLRQLDEQVTAAMGEVAAEVKAVPREGRYETILTSAELEAWLKKLESAPLVSIDTETTSLDYMKAELVGISFAVEPRQAGYIPLAHDYPGAPPQLSRDAVLATLKPFLEDPARQKVGHDLKYDAHVLAHYGIDLRGIALDRKSVV